MSKSAKNSQRPVTAASTSWGSLVDNVSLLILPIALLATALHNVISTDIWWQLATGRWVLDHGFPTTDPFSFAFPDRAWIELRWLYTVAARLLYDIGGFNVLILTKVLLLAAGLALLFRLLPGRPVVVWPTALGLTTSLALLFNRTFIRPELITYFFVLLYLFAYLRYKQGGRPLWLILLPLAQIIWVNSHTLFILGPVSLGLLASGETFHTWLRPLLIRWLPRLKVYLDDPWPITGRRLIGLWLVVLFCSLACLANPYFLDGALFPLTLFREISAGHPFIDLIGEFTPTLRHAGLNLTFLPYAMAALLCSLGFALNRRQLAAGLLFLCAAFFYLSLLAIRNIALFGLVAGPVIIANFSQWLAAGRANQPSIREEPIRSLMPWLSRGLVLSYILYLVPVMVSNVYFRETERRFGLGLAVNRFPIQAVHFAQQEGLPWPMLHNLGDGSYLIFAGGPGSVYTDGRLEVYDPADVGRAVLMFRDGQGLETAALAEGTDTILVRHYLDPAVVDLLHRAPEWRPVYYDASYALFVRQAAHTAALLERLGFDWADPPPPADEPPLPPDALPGWLPASWPDDPGTTGGRREASLGQLFLITGNLVLARQYLETAVALNPNNTTAVRQLQLLR
jgi:hypothetical protein